MYSVDCDRCNKTPQNQPFTSLEPVSTLRAAASATEMARQRIFSASCIFDKKRSQLIQIYEGVAYYQLTCTMRCLRTFYTQVRQAPHRSLVTRSSPHLLMGSTESTDRGPKQPRRVACKLHTGTEAIACRARSSEQLVFSLVAARAGSRSYLKLTLQRENPAGSPCVESICRL